MKYIHTKCGGEISVRWMKCTKCGKRWNPVSFLLTNDIRPSKEVKERVLKRKPAPAPKWADRFPGLSWFVGLLPKWPKWARVLTTVLITGGLIVLVLWLFGVF